VLLLPYFPIFWFNGIVRSETPNSSQSSPTRCHTPQRGERRSAPPRTPDSSGMTPSSRRAAAQPRRESPPPSPTPQRSSSPIPEQSSNQPRRSLRTIHPRHFYGDTPTPPPRQLKLCVRNTHLKSREEFIDPITNEEHNVCNQCRREQEEIRNRAGRIYDQINTNFVQMQQLGLREDGSFPIKTCTYLHEDNDPLNQCAISKEDFKRIQTFHEQLRQLKMEECCNCLEKWFDMKVDSNGYCSRCSSSAGHFGQKFCKANLMDPGPSVQDLAREHGLPIPEPCTQLEAMIISPVFNAK